jgi:hypothetical protein
MTRYEQQVRQCEEHWSSSNSSSCSGGVSKVRAHAEARAKRQLADVTDGSGTTIG